MPLGTTVGARPLAIASQSKRWGSDGGWARILRAASSSVDVAIDEDGTGNGFGKDLQDDRQCRS